jgi:hypothetical protein
MNAPNHQGDPYTSSQSAGVAPAASVNGAREATKRCVVCGEPIWVHALKCIHCDTDFTWRRYLAVGNTTLALTTALIAVIATSIPAIRIMFTADNSQLSAVFAGISASGETISMLLSNGGRRAGAINKITVAVTYGPDPGREFSILPHTKDDAAIFVNPGETKGAEFLFAQAESYWKPEAAKNDLASLGHFNKGQSPLTDARCEVRVSGVNADGSAYQSVKALSSCVQDAFPLFRKLADDAAANSASGPAKQQ